MLEFFGSQQGHDEVDAERQRDGQTEQGFEHGEASDAGQSAHIKREQAESGEAEGDKDDVRHGGDTPISYRRYIGCRAVGFRLGNGGRGIKKR